MVRPSRATDAELAAALAALPDWTRVDDTIERAVTCASFADAIAFVVRVGFAAEAADHHPDLDVRWRSVRVVLTTHDAGGLSELDFALARTVDAIAATAR